MITFRRKLLDQALQESIPLMRGHVLDIGGRKSKKRGAFRPPLGQVATWKYVNPDAGTDPDFAASAEELPVADSSIDTVVMTEVLEYIPDPLAALKEIHRVLGPSGTALVSVPLHSPVHGDWQYDRFRFTKTGLEQLCLRSGFVAPSIREMGGLGAVVFDLCEATTGYGHPGPGLLVKVARRLLYLCAPFFRALDRPSSFVTTGYFLVLKKAPPAGGK